MRTRKEAMKWWNSLPDYTTEDVLHKGKHGLCTNHHGSRTWQSLTGREIENIWNKEKEMGKVKEFRQEVEAMLINIYNTIGMDKPTNHEDILNFIADDVAECADPVEWHSGDVGIAFRRWIEAQAKDEEDEGYFKIVATGYDEELQREQIQIHGGENANIFLIKNEEGFIVDVYGQQDLVESMTIWEMDLESEEE